MRYTFLVLIPLFWLTACNNSPEAYIKTADSVTLANDVSSLTSGSRKIIRTADIRCRVSNVYDAASKMEDITRSLDGLVADSKMENAITHSETVNYKPDSQKLVRSYTGTAHLTLRVPFFYLDTLMKQIPALSDFIESRNLKQQDVTLAYLSNSMRNEAAGVAPPVVVKKEGSNELVKNPKVTAIDSDKQDVVIDRRVQNLQLLDDANYATIQVELYQPDITDVQIIANPAYTKQVPFFTSVSLALSNGLDFVKALIVVMIQVWPIWVMGIIVVGVYKAFRKRKPIAG